jgi:hypothetical protein
VFRPDQQVGGFLSCAATVVLVVVLVVLFVGCCAGWLWTACILVSIVGGGAGGPARQQQAKFLFLEETKFTLHCPSLRDSLHAFYSNIKGALFLN